MANQDYISLAEAAAEYELSPSWLRRLAQQGKLRAYKIARNWLTTHAAVQEYLDSPRKRGPKPGKAA
jgi:excisionase family DNA binding protein